MKRLVPPIVVRVLIFMYEEQTGCVKLSGKKSDSFRISNGTRQGSVLSPALFSVYLDDLIKELREQGLGCHIGGWWMGACGFADDLILLAPVRSVLQRMVSICEKYGNEHNLVFSTDPNPSKSKTKCLYFCGRISNVQYPAPVRLYGKDLPWVKICRTSGPHPAPDGDYGPGLQDEEGQVYRQICGGQRAAIICLSRVGHESFAGLLL